MTPRDCPACEATIDYPTSCFGGDLYGPCEYEECGGGCEYIHPCECPCHQTPTPSKGT